MTSLPPTAEEADLRDLVRRFLTETAGRDDVRRLMETEAGYDPRAWERLGELGVKGIAVPERYGGLGLGLTTLAVVLEEMGRRLYCGPFLSTACLAVPAILHAGDPADCERLLPGLLEGGIGTLAVVDADGAPTVARAHGSGTSVTGAKDHVVDGHVADVLVVAARDGGADALFVVDPAGPGVVREPMATLDLTRKLAGIRFDEAPARRLGGAGNGPGALAVALRVAASCLAAEMIGGAQRCLEMSVDHARQRYQFGRPIGSFQAVKHRCADMLIAVELARSVAGHALAQGDQDVAGDEFAIAASHAKAYCAAAYMRVAEHTVQVHGGIGFTWEHDAHLYLKRAKSCQFLLGDDRHHRAELARHLGL